MLEWGEQPVEDRGVLAFRVKWAAQSPGLAHLTGSVYAQNHSKFSAGTLRGSAAMGSANIALSWS